jgi:membrane fusion protein (multidrug efflux system)
MKSNTTRLSTVLALAALSSLVWVGCGEEKTDKAATSQSSSVEDSTAKAQVVKVVVQEIKTERFEDWQEYPAELRGIEDAILTTRTGGKISKIAKIGDRVSKGQSLCHIESDRFAAMTSQAQSALKMAENEQRRLQVHVDSGSIGKDALIKAKFDIESARVQLLQAKSAEEENRCIAPFSGVVVSRQAETWQFLNPGSPILRLARSDRYEAVLSMPEIQALGHKPGQKAEFFLATDHNTRFEGRLAELDLAADARSRTFTARVELPGKPALRPGMVGKVRVLKGVDENAILVPSNAILRLKDGMVAMVAGANGKAEQRSVVVAETQGSQMRVISGLKPGDKLIVAGAFRLGNGTPIKY